MTGPLEPLDVAARGLRGDVGLRQRAGRGVLVNGAFMVGINVLSLIRGFVVAAYLSTTDYGVWGIVAVILATVMWFRSAGIGEKFIEQDEADQEAAFQKAMTIDLALSGAVFVLGLVLTPILCLAYGEPQAIAPGLVLLLVIPAIALQSPLLVFYRRMDFVRQRRLQAADPIGGFVVAVVLAIAGAGYWSLVVAVVTGAWVAALLAVRASPYPIRLRWHRPTVREYWSFSFPLMAAGGAGVVVGQALVGVGQATVGLAGVGALTLTATITQFANRVDQVVTASLYPAICAVKDRLDLLHESLVTSNRLALMWSLPFSVGLALFAPDLVEFALGSEWQPAAVLLQLTGLAVGVHQVAFNWDTYYRARNDTRPIAWYTLWSTLVFISTVVPLLVLEGLDGAGAGFLIAEVLMLPIRARFLRRLFPDFRMVRHLGRAAAPVIPAAAAVVLLRLIEPDDRVVGIALGEMALFGILVVLGTIVLERALLREVRGYVVAGRATRTA